MPKQSRLAAAMPTGSPPGGVRSRGPPGGVARGHLARRRAPVTPYTRPSCAGHRESECGSKQSRAPNRRGLIDQSRRSRLLGPDAAAGARTANTLSRSACAGWKQERFGRPRLALLANSGITVLARACKRSVRSGSPQACSVQCRFRLPAILDAACCGVPLGARRSTLS